MNQRAQRTLVESKTRGAIESAQAGAAGRAYAVFIQRELVCKRGFAAGAKKLGLERDRR